MKKLLSIIALIAIGTSTALAMSSPPAKADADRQATQKTRQLASQIDQLVGFPSVVNGFEKRMVRMLYELRDNPEYKTYSYLVNMQGDFIFICNSIGFGINASIQFSNPERVYEGSHIDRGATFIPQPEPNGLFMPEGLAATYVMCVDEGAEELKPVYVEPEILVSPFPLH